MRTRESLVRAAAEVFEHFGYSTATMEQIAAQAQSTKGALYFHFVSKAALAQEVVTQQHAIWADLARSSSEWGLNGLETVERLIQEVSWSYADNPLMRAGVRLANEQVQVNAELAVPFVGWIKRLTSLLRAGQRDGSVSAEINCAAAARSIVASFYGIEEMSSRLTGREDLDRRVREWWKLLCSGLAPS
jgi:AcrR family transcriptional regulator